MSKPRFYEPGVIKPHPRVMHKTLNGRCDLYVGAGDDLIEAGVLQAHMLPPRVSLNWRPANVPREAGGGVMNLPGYLTVTRNPEGGYRVFLTVSREERAARQEATERKNAQLQAAMERQSAARQAKETLAAAPEKPHQMDADAFRKMGLMYGKLIERYAQNGCEGFALAPDDQQALLELAGEFQELLRSARVVDTRKRKHLMLAWSA